MIRTKLGAEVQIVAFHGKQVPPKNLRAPCPEAGPMPLVTIRLTVSGQEFYSFTRFLRADGGISEIDLAVHRAPVLYLGSENRKKAIKDAW